MVILEYNKAQAINSSDENLTTIVDDLLDEDIVNDETILNHIVGKSLVQLCAQTVDSKKKELLIVLDKEITDDVDLAKVIERRFIKSDEKNNDLVILNKKFMEFLTSKENENFKFMVNKFSILHHFSTEMISKAWPIVDFAANAIERMPNLEMVVLRGCSSAANSNNDLAIKQKKYKVLGQKHKIQDAPVSTNEFLFQQVSEKNKDGTSTIKTYLKFHDIDDNIIIKELMDIPLNTGNNKLTYEVEKKLASFAKENNLPLLSLPSLNNQINKIRTDWLRGETISKEDKKLVEAMQSGTRTYTVEKFPANGLADALEKELSDRGIHVHIKGYAGPYHAYPKAGSMIESSHGHKNLPKALKK